jgi:hypothetical protein
LWILSQKNTEYIRNYVNTLEKEQGFFMAALFMKAQDRIKKIYCADLRNKRELFSLDLRNKKPAVP